MNRRSFLRTASVAVPGIFLSRPLSAAASSGTGTLTPFKVASGRDRGDSPLSLFEGDTFYTKVSGRDTNGALYVFESTRRKPGGPAQHFHYEQDEWFFVMEGEVVIKVGDTTYEATAGDSVFAPRMIPHVWAKVGEHPARLLMAFQPAGRMEDYFRAASEGRLAKLPEAELVEFQKRHGFERTGPALSHHKR
jgi:mannose-6-phosphate isomerase-like protein (cupin superfamily)